MAKATVLACDVCGAWDSAATPVRRVTVAGPKFELCEADRAALLIQMGVPNDVAVEYQRMVNDKAGKTGALPPLSVAIDAVTERALAELSSVTPVDTAPAAAEASVGDPNGDPDQLDIADALARSSQSQPRATAPFTPDRERLAELDASIGKAIQHFGAEDTSSTSTVDDQPPAEQSAAPKVARPRARK